MILCVYKVPRPLSFESEIDDKGNEGKPSLEMTPLELTDGWYIIKSTFDEPILRAIQRGKIKRGSKLAIFGARVGRRNDLLTESSFG